MVVDQMPAAEAPRAAIRLFPDDLAEWHGAVDLTFRSRASADGQPLLAAYLYALARGTYGAEDIRHRFSEDPCLRHLACQQFPDPEVLRVFRRENAGLLVVRLARLIRGSLADLDGIPRLGFDPSTEARHRVDTAAFADRFSLEP